LKHFTVSGLYVGSGHVALSKVQKESFSQKAVEFLHLCEGGKNSIPEHVAFTSLQYPSD